jgi:hypothetical protein
MEGHLEPYAPCWIVVDFSRARPMGNMTGLKASPIYLRSGNFAIVVRVTCARGVSGRVLHLQSEVQPFPPDIF